MYMYYYFLHCLLCSYHTVVGIYELADLNNMDGEYLKPLVAPYVLNISKDTVSKSQEFKIYIHLLKSLADIVFIIMDSICQSSKELTVHGHSYIHDTIHCQCTMHG